MAEEKEVIINSNLPDVVASMEMLTVDATIDEEIAQVSNTRTRYRMRRRLPNTTPSEGVINRRCSQRPKKRSYSMMESDGEIKDYYLDKNIKRKPNSSLETIHEEMEGMGENSTVISGRKLRRLIQFANDSKANDAKIKKRKAKIKKVFGTKYKLKSKNMSMQTLVKKLCAIRAEAPPTPDKKCFEV